MRTEEDNSPAEEATIPGRIQGREELSPATTENLNPRVALHRADEAMKKVVPIDPSNTWEGTVGRIKWVMDTLGPIAEVRAILF